MDNYTTPPSQTNPGNAIAVPIFGILSTILMAVPFKLLVRSKNMPACALILLIGFTNIMGSVNAILWPNEAKMLAYNGAGLCDIEVYFRTPLFTAEATALCCLTRDLARAVDSDNPRLFESRAMRRRRLLLDCLFVFGPSIIQLPMNFIVQSNRYGLIPVYGCLDMMDSSWPRVVFMILWPLVFSAINAYYACKPPPPCYLQFSLTYLGLVIYRLRKHRGHLSATLSSTGSGLDTHKFIKLFLVAISVLVINLPFSAYFFYTDLPSPMVSFTWARVHNPATWYQIAYFQTSDSNQVQYNPWGSIAYGAVVFLVYGFTNDAINVYRRYIGKAGLARWWPELLEDRVLTRRSASNGSSTGTARWATRFDVVSKTVSYLDGSRKYSQATSTIVPSSDG
jgi:pheromone a factor receptor